MALLFIFSNFSVFATEDEKQAENVAENCMFSLDGNLKELDTLKDENTYTTYKFEKAASIKIKSDTPISYLYIVFNKTPSVWELVLPDGQTSPNGKYGFLHDFIKFSDNYTELSLSFAANTEICDIYLYTDGKLPKNVQDWTPPYDDADMLLLPTHADDEFLYFGSTIPYYAGQLNKKVQVAYLTNHEAEPYRQHELLNALWNAGVRAYPVIPQFKDYYADSLEKAKTLYDTDAMLEYQVKLIRRFRPEVVVGHAEAGEYGHGVHILNTELLKQSLELAKDVTAMEKSYKIYGAFDVPKTYLHSYSKNQLVLDVDTPLSRFDGKTAFEVAKDSFALHKSQTKYFEVTKSGRDDCRKFGLYRTTVGEDVYKNDMFENITEEIVNQAISSSTESSDTVSEAVSSVSADISVSSVSEESVSSEDSSKRKGDFASITSPLLMFGGILLMIFGFRRLSRNQKQTRPRR